MEEKNQEVHDVGATQCPHCEKVGVSTEIKKDNFEYGTGDETVLLSALVSVHQCSYCGFAFTSEAADIIRHDVICRHLGLMLPDEIVDLRKQYGMSQKAFANATGLGSASLARWESRSMLQGESANSLMYLLRYPENMARLQEHRKEREKSKQGES